MDVKGGVILGEQSKCRPCQCESAQFRFAATCGFAIEVFRP
jgi:hypothetical protein